MKRPYTFEKRTDKMNNENTFVVQIKATQANTWQGSVLWVEKEKKETFRSALELMKLLDSALGEEK